MTSLTIKRMGQTIGVAALSLCAAQLALAANISIGVNQPGAYGRVTFGEPIPQQAWVYQEPMVIAPMQYGMQRQPIYLYVPVAQSSNWGRYCNYYNACAQPVIFVQDRWVRERHEQYVQQYPGQRGRGRALGHDRDHDGIKNGRDRDRDGDGVRNSRDRQPNNPYRN